jgi:hypothetical protein
MCQAQIKIFVIILLQELQSSVRAGQEIRAGGRPPTEKWLVNRYEIVVISELFRNNHAHHQSVTQALAHDPFVSYSLAPRPKRHGFKFEKKSRKLCDRFEKKRFRHNQTSAFFADFGTKTFSVYRSCACNNKCDEIFFAIVLVLENTLLFLDII